MFGRRRHSNNVTFTGEEIAILVGIAAFSDAFSNEPRVAQALVKARSIAVTNANGEYDVAPFNLER